MPHRICIIPEVRGVGGMVSFRHKFTAGLQARGIRVCGDVTDMPLDAVLIIGGTRNLAPLLRAKRRGIRIVQRLDGINWIHRRRRTSLRHFVRAELGNLLQSFIRGILAERIVYQSDFARHWWEDWYGATRVPYHIVLNGVDLKIYTPKGSRNHPPGRNRLLVVEGSMSGGYSAGLANAIRLAEILVEVHHLSIELMVVGYVAPAEQRVYQGRDRFPIVWAGTVPRERIPEIDRSAHLLFSAELIGACPNSVIEALACGLPVVSFDTGSLPELVTAEAGRLVPYGGDVWKVEPPDVPSLARAAVEVLSDLPGFSAGARRRAESAFGLDKMIDGYVQALLG